MRLPTPLLASIGILGLLILLVLWGTGRLSRITGELSSCGLGITAEYPFPAGATEGGTFTAGPHNTAWVTQGGSAYEMTTGGNIIASFAINPGNAVAFNPITEGPDGNMWVGKSNGSNGIEKITVSSGTMTNVPISSGYTVAGITAGPDGDLWFTEANAVNNGSSGNKIGRMTVQGSLTEFTLPNTISVSDYIATGPDGQLWFSEPGASAIGKMTTSGQFTQLASSSIPPFGKLILGPNGNMWLLRQQYFPDVWEVTAAGQVTQHPLSHSPISIAIAGQNMWYTSYPDKTAVELSSTGGEIVQVPLADSQGTVWPGDVIQGPDGNMWFWEFASNYPQQNKIGVIGSTCAASSSSSASSEPSSSSASSTSSVSSSTVSSTANSCTPRILVYNLQPPPLASDPVEVKDLQNLGENVTSQSRVSLPTFDAAFLQQFNTVWFVDGCGVATQLLSTTELAAVQSAYQHGTNLVLEVGDMSNSCSIASCSPRVNQIAQNLGATFAGVDAIGNACLDIQNTSGVLAGQTQIHRTSSAILTFSGQNSWGGPQPTYVGSLQANKHPVFGFVAPQNGYGAAVLVPEHDPYGCSLQGYETLLGAVAHTVGCGPAGS